MSFISRSKNFLGRIKTECKEFSPRKKEYGFKVAFATFVDGLIPPEKHPFYIKSIEKYVDRFMTPIIEKYKTFDEPIRNSSFEKIPVWCCWWQGVEQMPEIVKLCNNRLQSLIPEETELHMITAENYREYVTLPQHVLDKLESGKMSITALSDVLRVALIAEHGGFWIDSTVFISNEFPVDFIRNDYYAQRMYGLGTCEHEACKGRWSGFLTAGRPNCILFRVLRDAFFSWWEIHNSVIDYVIYDYFLLSAYKQIPAIQKLVDALPNNNVGVFDMYKVLHKPYSQELYETLTRDTNLHKLTYKIELFKETQDGESTLYAYLLNTYMNGDRNER